MKKWIPWIVAAVAALVVLASLRPRPESGFQTSAFGKLPVLLNGRIQPLDSVARNSLLQLRARQTVALEGRQSLSAIEWLMEVMMKPEVAEERKVFRIDNLEVLAMLKLAQTNKYYSFGELRPSYEEIGQQAGRVLKREEDKVSTPENRSVFEKQLMKLYNGVVLFQRLQVSLRPPNSDDFVAELADYQKSIAPGVAAVRASEAGEKFDKEAYDKILGELSQFQTAGRFAAFLGVPPTDLEKGRENWKTVGTSLLDSVRNGNISPAVAHYAAIVDAYRQDKPEEFNQAVAGYRQWLSSWFGIELAKGEHEFFYNRFQAFYQAMEIYVVAFLFAVVGLLSLAAAPDLSETLRRSAFWLVVVAGVIHTFGLVFRMVLEGRPPVTNLYSSAIFIGWGTLVLGLLLERIYKVGIGSLVASLAGFVTLVIAHNLALSGDTMEMLRAVLDTNFWLATHVVVVTLGYASTFVSGLLALVYVGVGVFTPLLTQKLKSQAPSVAGTDVSKALAKMVYGIVCFATLFSFTGTVLGGIWADQSWGRFWGWDPKENGALLIVLWNAIILHARWGGLVRERGLMNLAILGNVVTSFSWFGVNMLQIGLHSYGFMDGAFKWLMIFDATQLFAVGLGLLPLSYWRSFKAVEVAVAGSPAAARAADRARGAPAAVR